MGRREGGGTWVPGTQQRSEGRIRVLRENKVRDHNAEGSGKRHFFFPEPWLVAWEGKLEPADLVTIGISKGLHREKHQGMEQWAPWAAVAGKVSRLRHSTGEGN